MQKALDSLEALQFKLLCDQASLSVYESAEPAIILSFGTFPVTPPTAFQLIQRKLAPVELTEIAIEIANESYEEPVFRNSHPEELDRAAYEKAVRDIICECVPLLPPEDVFGEQPKATSNDYHLLTALALGKLERPAAESLAEFVRSELASTVITFKTMPTTWPAFQRLRNRVTGWDLDRAARVLLSAYDIMDRIGQQKFMAACLGAKI